MHNKTEEEGKGQGGRWKLSLAQITALWGGGGERIDYIFHVTVPSLFLVRDPRMLCDVYVTALDKLFRMVENGIQNKNETQLTQLREMLTFILRTWQVSTVIISTKIINDLITHLSSD